MSNHKSRPSAGRSSKRRKKKKIRVTPRFWIFLAVAVTLAIGIWGISRLAASASGQGGPSASPDAPVTGLAIAPGVTINGVDVGGMTKDEAQTAIAAPLDEMISKTNLTFTYETQTWTCSPTDIGMAHNADVVVLQAYEADKTETGEVDPEENARIAQEGEAFETMVSYDATLLRAKLNEIAATLGTPAKDATMQFNPDASSKDEMFVITEGTGGIAVNIEDAIAGLDQVIATGGNITVPLTVTTGEPEITAADLEAATKPLIYIEEGGELVNKAFYTTVKGSKSRRANVKRAIESFNGVVLQPGEELSFNEVTGERTAESGYQEAPGIAGDQSLEPTFGGGVCQASTTLYNAALLAGLDVTERNKHSIPSTYVRKGFDAMVNWPEKDMKFVNNTEYPICIKTWYSDDKAYVQIYGKPLQEGVAIRRVSTVLETIKAGEEIEYRVDKAGTYAEFIKYDDEEYVYRAASDGIRVENSLEYVNLSTGEVISTEVLHTDYYKPITAIVYRGAISASLKPSSPVTPTPSPTPTGDLGEDPMQPTPAEGV